MSSTFSSSSPSPLIPTFIQEFGMSEELGILTVSLFVCGYCVGPLLWGPLSEQYGRRPIFMISFFIYTVSGQHSFHSDCSIVSSVSKLVVHCHGMLHPFWFFVSLGVHLQLPRWLIQGKYTMLQGQLNSHMMRLQKELWYLTSGMQIHAVLLSRFSRWLRSLGLLLVQYCQDTLS